jgi:hypothetical protein
MFHCNIEKPAQKGLILAIVTEPLTTFELMDLDLSGLDLTELRNLLLKELRDFVTALDSEHSRLLNTRKERIKEIDREIELRKIQRQQLKRS